MRDHMCTLLVCTLEVCLCAFHIYLVFHLSFARASRLKSAVYKLFLANAIVNSIYLLSHTIYQLCITPIFGMQSKRVAFLALYVAECCVVAIYMGVVLSAFNRFCAIVQYSQYKTLLSHKRTMVYIFMQLGTATMVRTVFVPGADELRDATTIDRNALMNGCVRFACACACVVLTAPMYTTCLRSLFSRRMNDWKNNVKRNEVKRLKFSIVTLLFPLAYCILQLVSVCFVVQKTYDNYSKAFENLGATLFFFYVFCQPLSVFIYGSTARRQLFPCMYSQKRNLQNIQKLSLASLPSAIVMRPVTRSVLNSFSRQLPSS